MAFLPKSVDYLPYELLVRCVVPNLQLVAAGAATANFTFLVKFVHFHLTWALKIVSALPIFPFLKPRLLRPWDASPTARR
jgi:hypothetical protein